jgi:hypothetical protein
VERYEERKYDRSQKGLFIVLGDGALFLCLQYRGWSRLPHETLTKLQLLHKSLLNRVVNSPTGQSLIVTEPLSLRLHSPLSGGVIEQMLLIIFEADLWRVGGHRAGWVSQSRRMISPSADGRR